VKGFLHWIGIETFKTEFRVSPLALKCHVLVISATIALGRLVEWSKFVMDIETQGIDRYTWTIHES
jgi:hypothetical protein